MSVCEVMFKDADGFRYKHPERTCKNCKNYPCLENLDKLNCNFAAYGCKMFDDINIFD